MRREKAEADNSPFKLKTLLQKWFSSPENSFVTRYLLLLFLVYPLAEILQDPILLSFIIILIVWGEIATRALLAETGFESGTVFRHFTLISFMRPSEKVAFPVAAVSLVIINLFIFVAVNVLSLLDPVYVDTHMVFPPRASTWWNLPSSFLTALFRHADWKHLLGNMVFLLAFAAPLEERIGRRRLVKAYFLTAVAADFLYMVTSHWNYGEFHHGVGASGAISGLMGLYAVRCFFLNMVYPLPLAAPVFLKIRLNAMLLVGYYFLLDLKYGLRLFDGWNYRIAFWAHIGGFLGGFLLARLMGLHREAAVEFRLYRGRKSLADEHTPLWEAEEKLKAALELDPGNAGALRELAEFHSRYRATGKGRAYYNRLLEVQTPAAGLDDFKAFLRRYGNRPLKNARRQWQFSLLLARKGELESARRGLDALVESPATDEQTRRLALEQLRLVHLALDRPDSAARCDRALKDMK